MSKQGVRVKADDLLGEIEKIKKTGMKIIKVVTDIDSDYWIIIYEN